MSKLSESITAVHNVMHRYALAIDSKDWLYVADTKNHKIRLIKPQ